MLEVKKRSDMESFGISIRGRGHIDHGLPNQDSFLITHLADGWQLACVSDGAGSAPYSEQGSKWMCEQVNKETLEWLNARGWITRKALPKPSTWQKNANQIFYQVQQSICDKAKQNGHLPKDYHATVILALISPHGVLTANCGDGRAAISKDGTQWEAAIEPIIGKEEGSTAFLTWEGTVLNKQGNPLSAYVKTQSFTGDFKYLILMSDGLEKAMFTTTYLEEGTDYIRQCNVPHSRILTNNLKVLESELLGEKEFETIQEEFASYLVDGTKPLQQSSDDKTVIVIIN